MLPVLRSHPEVNPPGKPWLKHYSGSDAMMILLAVAVRRSARFDHDGASRAVKLHEIAKRLT